MYRRGGMSGKIARPGEGIAPELGRGVKQAYHLIGLRRCAKVVGEYILLDMRSIQVPDLNAPVGKTEGKGFGRVQKSIVEHHGILHSRREGTNV